MTVKQKTKNLTWVKGDRDLERPTEATARGGNLANSKQTASLKGGTTFGTTLHPYDGQSPNGDRMGKPAIEPRTGVNSGWSNHPRYYEQKTAAEAKLGRTLSNEEFERDHFVVPDSEIASGTSIFDPVLCEIIYRWFCPVGGRILDPFAGGSVRGIVAAKLDRDYVGIDLRPEQISANEVQSARICHADERTPRWIVGDALDCTDIAKGTYDLVFTCPPYGDLEVYSDDPRDISAMPFEVFLKTYRAIIDAACSMLKPDRFAAIVVGDFRDKKGNYRNFISETIAAFQSAGLPLYNEAILITALGSLPIRVRRQFESARKLGKTHQQVLIFIKGDAKVATSAIGPVEIGDVEGSSDDTGTDPTDT